MRMTSRIRVMSVALRMRRRMIALDVVEVRHPKNGVLNLLVSWIVMIVSRVIAIE
jgi:hypothetical protein